MKDLSRHIEYLLCSHDSVTIPEIGTLETENLPARFVGDESVYLPPVRSVNLNTRRKDDDGMLQNCLVHLHHVTQSVARKWVFEYVGDIKQTLLDMGQMDMGTIGRIIKVGDNLIFEACQAGVDSPSYYGLDSFHMAKLPELARARKPQKQDTHVTISLKRTTLSRIAAAAAVLIVVLSVLLPNYGNFALDQKYAKFVSTETIESIFAIQPTHIQEVKKVQPATPAAAKPATPQAAKPAAPQVTKPAAVEQPQTSVAKAQPEAKPASQVAKPAVQEAKPAVQEAKPAPAPAPAAQPAPAPAASGYCIVMASAITHEGAQFLIKKLAKEGFANAVEHHDGTMRRVVLTGYHNEAAARAQLELVRSTDTLYSGSWIKVF